MDIGRNNYASLLEVCKRNNVRIRAEHVGGTMSRTMRLDVGTGRVTVGNRRAGNVEL
jgi:chemotaxis receptor (MCP) glutamine deamidase CheD